MRSAIILPYLMMGALVATYFLAPDKDDQEVNVLSYELAANPHGYKVNENEVSALKQRIELLEQENQQLRLENQNITAQLTRQESQPLPQGNFTAVDVENKVNEKIATINSARTFSDKLMEKMRASPEYNLTRDLEEEFEKESVDPTWAIPYEGELHQLFETSAELRGLALESIHCKAQRCQIKVLLTSLAEANQASEALNQAMEQANPNIVRTPVITTLASEENTLSWYLARDNSISLLK